MKPLLNFTFTLLFFAIIIIIILCFCSQGHLVRYNESGGILPMDDKLTLRNIKKSASGEYSCSATNSEGETYSPPFRLEIQCEYVMTRHIGFKMS